MNKETPNKVMNDETLNNFIQKQNNVSYIFSGSMSVKDRLIEEIAGSNGAFGGRILTIEIKPFSYETTNVGRNYLILNIFHFLLFL